MSIAAITSGLGLLSIFGVSSLVTGDNYWSNMVDKVASHVKNVTSPVYVPAGKGDGGGVNPVVFSQMKRTNANKVGNLLSGTYTKCVKCNDDGWYLLCDISHIEPNIDWWATVTKASGGLLPTATIISNITDMSFYVYRDPEKHYEEWDPGRNAYVLKRLPESTEENVYFPSATDNDITAYVAPGKEREIVGTLKSTELYQKDKTLTVNAVDGADGWYAVSSVHITDKNGAKYAAGRTFYVNLPSDKFNVNINNNSTGQVSYSQYIATQIANDAGTLYESVYDLADFQTRNSQNEATRIFGMPYSFTKYADYPLYDRRVINPDKATGLGREYAENIYAEAPIIYLMPGVPRYMPGISQKDKEFIDKYAALKDLPETSNALGYEMEERASKIHGRYYDLVPAYDEYIKYVNILCRTCAVFMGIGDKMAPGTTTPYAVYNWSRYSNFNSNIEENAKIVADKSEKGWIGKAFDAVANAAGAFNEFVYDQAFGEYQYIKCYVSPQTSIDSTFGNNTTNSKIAGLFDNVRDIVREANFFIQDDTALGTLKKLAGNTIDGLGNALSAADSSLGIGVGHLITSLSDVLTGSNIAFPEMWSDSDYNQSYSFTIDLISPYGDEESIYLNVIVPMMHLIALAMPRQVSSNAYGAPFLVRLFAKGWCSTDLGIIDSIRITKGGDGDAWTPTGLPTAARIELSIKDLYSKIFMPKSATKLLRNNGLIDFLSVTCGVNVVEPNFLLKLNLMTALYGSNVFDIPSKISNSIIQGIRNATTPIFSLTGRTM